MAKKNKIYRTFRTRKYGPVIYNPRNTILISPEDFFLGNALTTHPDTLKEQIKNWLEFKSTEPDFIPLFPLDKNYLVWLGEHHPNNKRKRKKRKLVDLNLNQIVIALLDKIKTRTRNIEEDIPGNTNLWNYHGHLDTNKRAISKAHGGKEVLTAKVKHCGDKITEDNSRYHSVQIDDPYKHSSIKFNNLVCTCMDSFWSGAKRGKSNFQASCKHSGALIDYLNRNPQALQTYIRLNQWVINKFNRPLEIFSPYQTEGKIDPKVIKWFKKESLSHISNQAQQPVLDHLKIEILMARYIENMNLADISKKLLRLPIYTSDFIDMILNDKVFFEVMPQSQLFGEDSNVHPQLAELQKNIDNSLFKQGYKLKGYCYEKRNSPHEIVAMQYVRNPKSLKPIYDEVRVIFGKNSPPLLIRRSPLPNARKYPFREYKRHKNPFAELYSIHQDDKKLRRFDDRTRKHTLYKVELPTCFIPDIFLPDYAKCIRKHFPGGFKRLIPMIENSHFQELFNFPRKSLIYSLSKLNN